jgi:hypothetical protein
MYIKFLLENFKKNNEVELEINRIILLKLILEKIG